MDLLKKNLAHVITEVLLASCHTCRQSISTLSRPSSGRLGLIWSGFVPEEDTQTGASACYLSEFLDVIMTDVTLSLM